MELIFRKIASINMWYDYFLPKGVVRESQIPENYSITEFFTIVPSTITAQKLKDYKIKILKTRFGIELYTQSRAIGGNNFEPIIIPTLNELLAFEVVVKYPSILNSGVVQIESEHCLSLSNMNSQTLSVDNGDGGTEDVVYLNSEFETYSGAATYNIEKLLKKGTDYFLSLRANNNKPTSNTSYWRAIGKVNCVNSADSFKTAVAGIQTDPNSNVKGLKVFIQDRNENKVAELAVADSLNEITSFNLRETELGLKELFVNDMLQSTWVSTNANRRTLAIVEIAIQGNPTGLAPGVSKLSKEQMLFGNGTNGTTNGEILNNTWVIRILNKSTIWKYNFNKDQVFSNTDLATAGFEKLSDKEIQSKENIPLTQKSVEVDAGLGILLPNPNQDSMKIVYDNNENVEKYVSELYVNI